MAVVEMLFHVPAAIEEGLRNGTMIMDGSVIRYAEGRKLIAKWLEVISTHDVNPDGLGRQIRQAAQIGKSFSRTAHPEQLLLTAGASASVINSALTAVSVAIIMKRIDQLAIDLKKTIKDEFHRDRVITFKGSLESARNALSANNPQLMAQGAIRGLYESREQFFEDFDELVSQTPSLETAFKAEYSFVNALYADQSSTNLALHVGEKPLALERLSEVIPKYHTRAKQLVELWLSLIPNPLTTSQSSEADVDRYIQMRYWLADDPFSREEFLFQMINEIRGMKPDGANIAQKVFRRTSVRFNDALSGGERAVENFQRLQGYELEILAERLNIELPDTAEAQEYLVVDWEALQAQS